MKGDFTRDTFDANKHFSRVLWQQGRTQLDADFNEQAAILLHYFQTLAVDLIGPYGGPAKPDGSAGNGFKITQLKDTNGNPIGNDFAILRGNYYVDGILCENDGDIAHYAGQADYPLAAGVKLNDGTFLVYLDVWERHITTLEDDYIREKALGGSDTATRAKVAWQVKLWPATDELIKNLQNVQAYPSTWKYLVNQWQSGYRGRLQAMLKPLDGQYTDPCITPPQSGFRGAENQLYRVEIHSGGTSSGTPSQATFKWSRDNGSIVAEWTDKQGNDLIVGNARGFAAGQWVELTDDTRELRGERGILVKLATVESEALTIDPDSTKESTERLSTFIYPKVRRWDQQETEDIKFSNVDKAIPVTEGSPIDIEDGIQIQFATSSANDPNRYRTGDYWLIPARTATGKIEWPWQRDAEGQVVMKDNKPVPDILPPHGVEHHYAPLWIISVAGGSVTAKDPDDDLRRQFKQLGLPVL
jgi:hypothetical protein